MHLTYSGQRAPEPTPKDCKYRGSPEVHKLGEWCSKNRSRRLCGLTNATRLIHQAADRLESDSADRLYSIGNQADATLGNYLSKIQRFNCYCSTCTSMEYSLSNNSSEDVCRSS